ncbi:MAG TPA: bifunctional diaminohydroxyphosphoribosylaminopyrimidine deaminase/5-amino-6-(5-phosphoribosylamino)uracil reductase RibD [Polyangiales bacterium]
MSRAVPGALEAHAPEPDARAARALAPEALDARMMALALRLAERGRTSPNPHVGAVVAEGERVLATGYHHEAGEAHGEIDALQKLGGRAPGATLYVTLEPCNHYGRTGPCAEAVIAAGVRRVVIGCEDRIPGHGGGAKRLRAAGIEVSMGVLRAPAERLVADFYKLALRGLPYVTLKAAVTLDGRMASQQGDSRWVTGAEARKHVHRMRDRSDAVMVGVGTVLADDPALTVRDVPGKSPLRVVLDSALLTPLEAQLVQSARAVPTLIFHGPQHDRERARMLTDLGVELSEVPRGTHGLDLSAVLSALGRRDVMRLLVEGGPSLHGALLEGDHVDYAAVFVAPRILADPAGMPLAIGQPKAAMSQAFGLAQPRQRRFGDDVLIEGPLSPKLVRRSEGSRDSAPGH